MAKFKKLALLCTALLTTASMAVATGCNMDWLLGGSSSEASSEVESSEVESSEDEDESSEDEDESSEDESSEDVSSEEEGEDESSEDESSEDESSEDESSEDESSEDDSSDEGEEGDDFDTSVLYAEVVADNVNFGDMGAVTGQTKAITFNAPAAGKYAIYAMDSSFTFASAEDSDNFVQYYVFEVAEAGEVTVYANYFAWDAETNVNVDYYIYYLNDYEVSVGEGSDDLLANAPITVTFTAPADGTYVLSSTTNEIQLGQFESDGTLAYANEYVFENVVAGQTVTCYLQYINLNEEDFTFNWTVSEYVEQEAASVVVGDNTVAFVAEDWTAYNFTATEDGEYTFKLVDGQGATLGYYDADYDMFGYANYNESQGFDYKTVTLAEGESYTIGVYGYSSDGEAVVTVEKAESTGGGEGGGEVVEPETIYVYAGDNEITLTAEEGIYATPSVEAGDYEVTWTGDVSVGLGFMTIASGETVSIGSMSYFYIYSETDCTITLTLTAVEGGDEGGDEGGETVESDFVVNEVLDVVVDNVWNDFFVTFVAPESGEYTLSAADGETNAWVDLAFYDANFDELAVAWDDIRGEVFTSYTFEAAAGDVVYFWVNAWDENADTISLIITGDVEETVSGGTFEVTVSNMEQVEIPVNLAAGTYTVSLTNVSEFAQNSDVWFTFYINDEAHPTYLAVNNNFSIEAEIPAGATLKMMNDVQVETVFVTFTASEGGEGGGEGEEGGVVEESNYIDVYVTGETTSATIPAGKYANFICPAWGEFTITWTGDVTVVVDTVAIASGDVVSLQNSTIVVTPVDGTVDCEVALTLVAYVAPAPEFVLDEVLDVEVDDAWNGTVATFTATEAGNYVLSAAEGEENAYIMIETATGSELIELPYAFTLEAGASINFIVSTNDMQLDTISLVVSAAVAEPNYIDVSVTGETTSATIPAGKYANFICPAWGEFTITWTGDVTVVVDGVEVASGAVVALQSSTIVVTPVDATADCEVALTLVAYVEPAPEFVLDEVLDVEVDDVWNGPVATFTATEAGDYVLSAAEGEENAYIMVETAMGSELIELPYAFTLEAGASINFIVSTNNMEADTISLVVEVAPLTMQEIVDMAYALQPYEALEETYTLSGTIICVDTAYSTSYYNVTVTIAVEDREDYPIQCYRMKGTGADVIAVGNYITVSGILKNYNGTIEFDAGCTLDSYATDNEISDAAKVATVKYNLALATDSYDNSVTDVALPASSISDVTVAWSTATEGATVAGNVLNVPAVSETLIVALTATITCGEVSFTKDFTVTVNYVPAGAVSKTYTFSDYAKGEQYAIDEEHVLDDLVTVTTTNAHFTTQLRLYSSSTYDGYAIIKVASGKITGFGFNAGNKRDTINVYGSTDGSTWTLIEGVAITATSYNDYAVATDFSAAGYTYLKLDVAGTQQVRLQSITLTVVS